MSRRFKAPAAAASFAQILGARGPWTPFWQRNFTGGENRSILPELMKPDQLIMAMNCTMTPDGLLQTRLGKTKINLASLGAGPVLGAWRWGKENGTKYLTVQHGTGLYNVVWDGVTPFDSFGAPIRNDLAPGVPLKGIPWKDNLILSNGVDVPFRFDGAACANLAGAPPKFAQFCVYAGRLWVIPTTALSCIQCSGLETFDTWDALDIYKIRTGDGDNLVGLAAMSGGMMAFKSRSCWPVFGTDRFSISIPGPIEDSVGCIAPASILSDGVFLGNNGLYSFTLQDVELVAKSHKPLLDVMTLADRQTAIAVPLESEGRVPLHFANGLCLNLDAQYGGVTTWSGINASCFAVCNAAGDDGVLIVGDATNGQLYRLDNQVDDDGVTIQTEIQTAYSDAGSPGDKIWRMFQPEIEPLNDINQLVYYKYDLNYGLKGGLLGIDYPLANNLDLGTDDWGEANWGTVQRVNVPWYLHGVRGNRISFSVACANRIKFLGYVSKFTEAGYL
jgi:hypothetical protein